MSKGVKNSKFFVVMVNENFYMIRDCHESIQYNFASRDELIFHLKHVYNFCEKININGYSSNELNDFNNIEFLIIKNNFNMTLDETIFINEIH
jgi:hypothetical protein